MKRMIAVLVLSVLALLSTGGVASASSAPIAPSGLTVKGVAGGIPLNWKDNSNNENDSFAEMI
jgi:hypothetical protein